MARTSLFGPKDGGDRVQGGLTSAGASAFELARVELFQLVTKVTGRMPAGVSDGDTIEYLARGRRVTRAILKGEHAV